MNIKANDTVKIPQIKIHRGPYLSANTPIGYWPTKDPTAYTETTTPSWVKVTPRSSLIVKNTLSNKFAFDEFKSILPSIIDSSCKKCIVKIYLEDLSILIKIL